jgi:hypothetical protein
VLDVEGIWSGEKGAPTCLRKERLRRETGERLGLAWFIAHSKVALGA